MLILQRSDLRKNQRFLAMGSRKETVAIFGVPRGDTPRRLKLIAFPTRAKSLTFDLEPFLKLRPVLKASSWAVQVYRNPQNASV